ncbi:DUF7261 family protein [Halovenus marina]|uniref:DUF7261 family protein n=1 Tax=Halovenus marina TaxID=3396621 RepID=UPI003F576E96
MTGDRSRAGERAQVVLLAAALLAMALVPLVFAYLQLGYHDDIVSGDTQPTANGERTLERGVHDAVATVDGKFRWTEREQAVDAVRDELRPVITTVTTARLESGITYEITYNQTRGQHWASDNCPHGPSREFGPCQTTKGVVVQERQGRTYVLAVALDIETTTPTREELTATVIRVETA